ncbi:MAG: cation diffusion facilitator family transporter [Bryobacteraceae bacterium]
MESSRAVWFAVACDLGIGVVKFIAAAITGSSAMLSEGFHSIVDSVNGFLLLWGRRASGKPADLDHPFGYGKELYFWSLIVAVLIFAIGGGLSLYEGVHGVLYPVESTDDAWNYGVLAIAAVFEVITVVIAARDFRRSAGRHGYWRGVHTSKDPTLFTVLLDNVAAVFGVLFAFLGIFLGHLFQLPLLDGVGAILVGLTLAAVAVILAIESKGLLIGEGVDRPTREKIRQLAAADPAVERVGGPLTMYFGPSSVLLALEVQFHKGLSAAEVTAAVDRLEKSVRGEYPFIERIFIEAESLSRTSMEAA